MVFKDLEGSSFVVLPQCSQTSVWYVDSIVTLLIQSESKPFRYRPEESETKVRSPVLWSSFC